jgi:hypothetical protein
MSDAALFSWKEYGERARESAQLVHESLKP